MFASGFSKTAGYDYKEHMADLLAVEHKHMASKMPGGKVSPKAVVASMGARLTAIATDPAKNITIEPKPAPEDPTRRTPDELEAQRVSYMGETEKKSFYRGLTAGMGL